MSNPTKDLPVLVAGGGIGGLAAALALVRQGFKVTVLEQAPEIGEIGAGIQLGPNAFHAFDALGVGDKARGRAVYTDYMVMHDALDEYQVGKIPTGEAFLKRFGNPYAVIHRQDIHNSLLEGAQETGKVEFITNTRVERVEQDGDTVTVHCTNGKTYTGQALIGADGGKSVVRAQYVNDPPRVTGHVVYRAVVEKKDFPENLQWNAASIWVGPNCHLVHYPLRGGEQYNVVVTFHSRNKEEWGVTDGSKEEVQSYFQGICRQAAPADRPAQELEALGHRRPRTDRHLGLRPRHDSWRRRPPHHAIHGAGRLHGAGRRSDAGRGPARESQRLDEGAGALPEVACGPHGAHRAVGARDGPPVPRQGRGASGAQRPVERPHARALLRCDGMALRLERQELSRPGLN